jgi:ATPase subunit of ABC transporter with duplicated ATPase domains
MRAKATKAKAAQGMFKRAEKLLAGVEGERRAGPRGQAALPRAGAVRQDAADRAGPVQVVRLAGDLHRRRPGDRPRRAGRGAGLNGAGKTTLLRVLSGTELPDTGEVLPGHGLRLGYYAQEHDTLDTDRTVLENMRSSSPDLAEPEARRVLGLVPVQRDVVHQSAGTLSGGEKTRLALATLVVSGANVLRMRK